MAPGWPEYLRQARWFAAKDSGRLTAIEPLDWYTPDGMLPAVRSELARVERTDGEQTYHLLVGYLPRGAAEPEGLVGQVELPEFGEVDVVDAPASVTAMQALISALAQPDRSSPAGVVAGVRLLSAEQSNSAVIAGDSLVKIYRRLSAGPNPEPEMLAALAGGPVPQLHGVVSRAGYDLLASIEFLADAQDGWEFATAACASGRPIDGELAALGRALREVHDRLADAFGMRTSSGAALRERLLDDLDRATAEVPVLEPHRDALASVLLAVPDDDLPTQRVHGDFHLGQALLTPRGWRIIDFEGEPGAPMAERREFDSAWRDVAGLLRSLDYVRSAHADPSGPEATTWYRRSRQAFLAGYDDDLEPFGPLAAHEVARMVYEVGYEVRNRPDWVGIPLSAVENVATSTRRESNGV